MKKITGIEAQKDPNRVNIFLDGEFAFGLARTTAAWLEKGQSLDDLKIERLRRDDDLERATQKALNFLSYQDRSEKEVRDNLTKAEYSPETIENVLAKLTEMRLVDDRKFAKAWIENRNEFRPRGRRALAYELRRKGIASELVSECLDEGVEEEELAMKAGRMALKRIAHLSRPEFFQKMIGYLARKGFGYEAATLTARNLWSENKTDGDPQIILNEETA